LAQALPRVKEPLAKPSGSSSTGKATSIAINKNHADANGEKTLFDPLLARLTAALVREVVVKLKKAANAARKR